MQVTKRMELLLLAGGKNTERESRPNHSMYKHGNPTDIFDAILTQHPLHP